MVHGVWLDDGAARQYRGVYVDTPYRRDPESVGAIPGREINRSNVAMLSHAGRILTLGEIGFPYELDPADLSSIGPFDYDGALDTAMTAHPLIDPATGELFFFGYGFVGALSDLPTGHG